ncbi:MAG: carboxyl-terminal protease [Pseudopedobacter saltans]|uniref:Carboxyl-terminal protease n=1 Tax=Pseudopedobacter saltans TaxID=151895 RepID=A0A2W5G8N8_9SPHI|nr:MAG: carboxyl-terminal protease [Pseudopedobacter saltans]
MKARSENASSPKSANEKWHIIAINDLSLVGKHFTSDSIHHKLKSIKDSKVELTIIRNNQKQNISVKKELVPKPSVVASYMINPTTGYIKITHFSETTYPEFMIALEKLKKQGLLQMVLDLRGNGGGIMQQAIDIVDEFLPDDKLVVYTQGSKTGKIDYKCKRDGLFEKGKIALLVDEESASASEIIAGALQDWDRAIIVGRRTFGKGLVQEQYNLSNGGALRLTIARYYTPLGRCIQKPYSNGTEAYENELQQRLKDGELEHNDTSRNNGKAYKTPNGKVVYDGGGISPDVFVPYDTVEHPKEAIEMYIHGWISEIALQYYENHKSTIDSYASAVDLNAKLQLGEVEWNELIVFANKKGISLSGLNPAAKEALLENLKADIAKIRWYPDGFYMVNNIKDPAIKAALDALSSSK